MQCIQVFRADGTSATGGDEKRLKDADGGVGDFGCATSSKSESFVVGAGRGASSAGGCQEGCGAEGVIAYGVTESGEAFMGDGQASELHLDWCDVVVDVVK